MDDNRMYTGTLANGFKYAVSADAVESMEFLDALEDMEENPLMFSRAVKILLGREQRAALYEHLKAHGLKTDVNTISDIVVEIMTAHGDLKNC